MKVYTTWIYAKDPNDGEMYEYAGPNITAISRDLAHEFCQVNGLGYCHIGNELVAEVPIENNIPQWDKMIDYETIFNN